MAEEWYYQLDDEKVRGPVTLNFLQTAYAQGKLRSRHQIRFRESGDWKAANSFRQMVEAREKYQKLLEKRKAKKQKTGLPDIEGETDDAIEAPTEVRSGGEAANELEADPWYAILIQLFTEAKLMPDPFNPEDRVWFMWVGRKLGPFSFYDLVKMGQEGTLKVSDWVSHADSEDWTPLSPEAEAGVASDQSDAALSDSSQEFALSDSHVAMPLSDSHIMTGGSDSWVSEGDSRTGYAVGDSGLLEPGSGSSIVAGGSGVYEGGSDSGTYGVPQAPMETSRPGSQPYRTKVKAAPPKLPDQVPSAVLAEADDDDDDDDDDGQDQASATALVAAQLLAGETPKPPPGIGGDSDSSGRSAGGPASEERKPLIEQIKEAGPREWAKMGFLGLVGLFLLIKLIGMLPASDHARYQAFLDIYAEVQARKEEKHTGSAWEKYAIETIPRLEEALLPLSDPPPEPGSGDELLLQGGRQFLMDFETRAVGQKDYKPWFLQTLNKAADELGYSPPEAVPVGIPPWDASAQNTGPEGE